MMRTKKLGIPEPCHQSWQQMTAVEGGRHCESCCKTVVDFTKMTNDEVINYLSISRKVCGRIHEHQMSSINLQLAARQSQNNGGWAKWVMAAAFFVSTAYNRANAQTVTQPTEQTINPTRQDAGFPLGKIAMPDTAAYQTLTGVVVGDDDNLPLPGVSIACDKGKANTWTDIDGKFKIRVPISAKVLTITFVGYEQKVIKLKKINKVGTLRLKINATMLGGMGVTRPSLLSQLYARLVNGLGEGKLNREI